MKNILFLSTFTLLSFASDQKEKSLFPLSSSFIKTMVFSPNGKKLAMTEWGDIHFSDVEKQLYIARFKGIYGNINTISFSPDGKILAFGTKSGSLVVYDYDSKKLIKSCNSHNKAINAITFFSNGTGIITGSSDETVRFWDIRNLTSAVSKNSESIENIVLTPNNEKLIYTQKHTLNISNPDIYGTPESIYKSEHKIGALAVVSDKECILGTDQVCWFKYRKNKLSWQWIETLRLPEEEVITQIASLTDTQILVTTQPGNFYCGDKNLACLIPVLLPKAIKSFALTQDKKTLAIHSDGSVFLKSVEDLKTKDIDLPSDQVGNQDSPK